MLFDFKRRCYNLVSQKSLSSEWIYLLLNLPLLAPFFSPSKGSAENTPQAAPLEFVDDAESVLFADNGLHFGRDPSPKALEDGENNGVVDPNKFPVYDDVGNFLGYMDYSAEPTFRARIVYEGKPPPEFAFLLTETPPPLTPGTVLFHVNKKLFDIVQTFDFNLQDDGSLRPNTPPVLLPITVFVSEDGPPIKIPLTTPLVPAFLGGPAGPVVDVDLMDTHTAQILSGVLPGMGVLTLGMDGRAMFDPAMDFETLALGQTKSVFFTYKVTDSAGNMSNSATVEIIVLGENDNPIALTDSAMVFAGRYVKIPVLANDFDIDLGDALSVLGVGQPLGIPALGESRVNMDFLTAGFVAFPSSIPAINQALPYQFTSFPYAAYDGNGGVGIADVNITIRDPFWYDTWVDNPRRSLKHFDPLVHGIKLVNLGGTAVYDLSMAIWFSIVPTRSDDRYRFDLTDDVMGTGFGKFRGLPIAAGTEIKFVLDTDADLLPFTYITALLGTLDVDFLEGTFERSELIVGFDSFDDMVGDLFFLDSSTVLPCVMTGDPIRFSDDALVGWGQLVGDVFFVFLTDPSVGGMKTFGDDVFLTLPGFTSFSYGDVNIYDRAVENPINPPHVTTVTDNTLNFGNDYFENGSRVLGDAEIFSLSIRGAAFVGTAPLVGGTETQTEFSRNTANFGNDWMALTPFLFNPMDPPPVGIGDVSRFSLVGTLGLALPDDGFMSKNTLNLHMNAFHFGEDGIEVPHPLSQTFGDVKDFQLDLVSALVSAPPGGAANNLITAYGTDFYFGHDSIDGGVLAIGDVQSFNALFSAGSARIFSGGLEARNIINVEDTHFKFGNDEITGVAAAMGAGFAATAIGDVDQFSFSLMSAPLMLPTAPVTAPSVASPQAESSVTVRDTWIDFGNDTIIGEQSLFGDVLNFNWSLFPVRGGLDPDARSTVDAAGTTIMFGRDILQGRHTNDVFVGDVGTVNLTDPELFLGGFSNPIGSFTMQGNGAFVITSVANGFEEGISGPLDTFNQFLNAPALPYQYTSVMNPSQIYFPRDSFVFDLGDPLGIGLNSIQDFRTENVNTGLIVVEKDLLSFLNVPDINMSGMSDIDDLNMIASLVSDGPFNEAQILFNNSVPNLDGDSISLRGIFFGAGAGEFDSLSDLDAAGLVMV